LYPLALLSGPVFFLLPVVVLLLAIVGALPGALTWSAAATVALVIWWALVYRQLEELPHYALLYPLGSAMLLYICLRAVRRGRRVEWKGRAYVAR
jgi:hypothetical protein